MIKAVTYLSTDRANDLLEFYQDNFGAKIISKVMGDDEMFQHASEDMQMPDAIAKDFVMNAEFELLGQLFMVSDSWEKRPVNNEGASICFTFDGNNEEEVALTTNLYKQAEAAGCEIVMPLGETEWTKIYGMFKDPFGISWMISAY